MSSAEILGILKGIQNKTMSSVMNDNNEYRVSTDESNNLNYSISKKFYLYLQGKSEELPKFEELETIIKSSKHYTISQYAGIIISKSPIEWNTIRLDQFISLKNDIELKIRITKDEYSKALITSTKYKELTVKNTDEEYLKKIKNIQNYFLELYAYLKNDDKKDFIYFTTSNENVEEKIINNEKKQTLIENNANNEIEKEGNKMKQIKTVEKLNIIKEYIEINEENNINTNTTYKGYPIGKWILDVLSKEKAGKQKFDGNVIEEFKKIHENGSFKLKKENNYTKKTMKIKQKINESQKIEHEQIFDISALTEQLKKQNENLKKINIQTRKNINKEKEKLLQEKSLLEAYKKELEKNRKLQEEFTILDQEAEKLNKQRKELEEETNKIKNFKI